MQITGNFKAPRHWPLCDSPVQWPVTRKMYPFDDVIMIRISYHVIPDGATVIYKCLRNGRADTDFVFTWKQPCRKLWSWSYLGNIYSWYSFRYYMNLQCLSHLWTYKIPLRKYDITFGHPCPGLISLWDLNPRYTTSATPLLGARLSILHGVAILGILKRSDDVKMP